VDCFAARVSRAGVWQELIPLVVETVEFRKHSPQQELGRGRVDPSPSKAQDVGPLAFDLGFHMIDFVENSVDAHACNSRFGRIEQKGNKRVNRASRRNPNFPSQALATGSRLRPVTPMIEIVDDLQLCFSPRNEPEDD
jgi:hypothetical protein